MTLEKAIKILNENVILSPKASKFKEAIEVVKFALEHQQAVINNLKKDCSVVEVNLEEAFLKECECEIEKAKEQAVREFSHKVIDYICEICVMPDIAIEMVNGIDNLAKEFAKDTNVRTNPEQVKGE